MSHHASIPVEQSFLDHHRIDGTPVLPGVMGIEGFAEVASASADGWTVVAVEDVAFARAVQVLPRRAPQLSN